MIMGLDSIHVASLISISANRKRPTAATAPVQFGLVLSYSFLLKTTGRRVFSFFQSPTCLAVLVFNGQHISLPS